jgi:phosphoadenosine phosphosulfate reductase
MSATCEEHPVTTIDAPVLSAHDVDELDATFAQHGDAHEIIRWLADTFPLDRLVVASAMTSVVLVDVVSRVVPGIEVMFLDTGYHFAETLQTADKVRDRYPIKLNVSPAPAIGDELWRTDPDACCKLRKVVPLEEALAGKFGWIAGVRRADSPSRANTPFIQLDKRGLVKVNPLAAWTDDDVSTYAQLHDVPMNPLLAQGYPSIGCWPCTRRPVDGEDQRAGRWSGQAKTECGLHL